MKLYLPILSFIFIATILSGCASKTERQFISGCKTSGIDESACECVYEKIEDKYGSDRLEEKFYMIIQTEEFQDEIVRYGMQCTKE
ncbi:hypothetical protein [Acinetobacter sp. ANC 3791]|uniref:hypothetical protein n=1 Tax=Acinetobacter sp. ANC 3791 TaxID=2529836 RepID=UPI00103B7440|nr:hypothetical protein [Acinetobacter sp. ANC 3791]TCB86457.1 hypothetical protein E0H90_01145 [Acinetobacter sp. ANC 3791]